MRYYSSFSVWAALLAVAALLAGCCANDTCDCNDLEEDSIRFRFKIGDPDQDPTSFRRSEVDTVRLVRYRLPPKPDLNVTVPPAPPLPDTIVLTRPSLPVDKDSTITFRIANTAPFPISGSLRVNSYRYAILLTNDRRQTSRLRVRQRYDVDSIKLKGDYQADGCCTCYANSRKEAYLRISTPGSSVPTLSESKFYDLKPPATQVIELPRPR